VGNTIKQLALRVRDGCFPHGIPFSTNFDILEELEVDVQVLFRLGDGDEHMLQHQLPGNIKKVLLNLERGFLSVRCLLFFVGLVECRRIGFWFCGT
jgi:hypothetical protein